MFGNSHIIDFQFIEFLKKKEVKISKYFLDNYSSKPVIEDIIKNPAAVINKVILLAMRENFRIFRNVLVK